MPIGLVARLYVRLSRGASFRKLLGDALMFGVPKDWHWIVHRSRRGSGSASCEKRYRKQPYNFR